MCVNYIDLPSYRHFSVTHIAIKRGKSGLKPVAVWLEVVCWCLRVVCACGWRGMRGKNDGHVSGRRECVLICR